ncbi:hypothetical protein CR513_16097, partial [Mucuna pruriens]
MNFHFNLIFIHKLTTHLNCRLIFSPTSYEIQDLSNLSVIEHAKIHNNLYILEDPINIPSFQRQHYFLIIVENYNRHTQVFLMKTKTETRTSITNFITLISIQFLAKVKMIKTNNDVEFHMLSYYSFLEIIHQTPCGETLQ